MVGSLLAVAGVVSITVSIWLAAKYVKFNRRQNSAGLTGQQVARQILDENGLGHIGVQHLCSLCLDYCRRKYRERGLDGYVTFELMDNGLAWEWKKI